MPARVKRFRLAKDRCSFSDIDFRRSEIFNSSQRQIIAFLVQPSEQSPRRARKSSISAFETSRGEDAAGGRGRERPLFGRYGYLKRVKRAAAAILPSACAVGAPLSPVQSPRAITFSRVAVQSSVRTVSSAPVIRVHFVSASQRAQYLVGRPETVSDAKSIDIELARVRAAFRKGLDGDHQSGAVVRSRGAGYPVAVDYRNSPAGQEKEGVRRPGASGRIGKCQLSKMRRARKSGP